MSEAIINIKTALQLKGFKHELIRCIIAQSAFETDNFTSAVLRRNNNLFGMRLPVKRQTTAVKDLFGYAYYNNLKDSVNDIALYLDYVKLNKDYIEFLAINPLRSYIEFLKQKKYFEADLELYYNGCLRYYKQYNV